MLIFKAIMVIALVSLVDQVMDKPRYLTFFFCLIFFEKCLSSGELEKHGFDISVIVIKIFKMLVVGTNNRRMIPEPQK